MGGGGGAVLYATYLLNRLPLRVINWKTPYEQLFKKEALYGDLKIFGCFSTNPRLDSDKFAPKASKCIFFGVSPGQKGYKLYELESGRVIATRNVVFHKQIFRYKYITGVASGSTNQDAPFGDLPLPIVPFEEEGVLDNFFPSNPDPDFTQENPVDNNHNSDHSPNIPSVQDTKVEQNE